MVDEKKSVFPEVDINLSDYWYEFDTISKFETPYAKMARGEKDEKLLKDLSEESWGELTDKFANDTQPSEDSIEGRYERVLGCMKAHDMGYLQDGDVINVIRGILKLS